MNSGVERTASNNNTNGSDKMISQRLHQYPSTITEVELIKSYVHEYFNNLDSRIKNYLEESAVNKAGWNKNQQSDQQQQSKINIDNSNSQREQHSNNSDLKNAQVQGVLLSNKPSQIIKKQNIVTSKQNHVNSQKQNNLGQNSFIREYFQGLYKVWSAFTKSIRSIALKQNEDIILNTVHFGKFYLLKINESQNSRDIVYQPPISLQNACKQVIKDKATLPFGDTIDHDLYLRDSKIEFREVKLNYMIIAKACNQSLNHVEKAIQELSLHLINIVQSSETGKTSIRLNMKIGQLMISNNKMLSFAQESYSLLLNYRTQGAGQNVQNNQEDQGSQSNAADDAYSIRSTKSKQMLTRSFHQESTNISRVSVNSDTLSVLLSRGGKREGLNKSQIFAGNRSKANQSYYGSEYFNTPLINSINKQVNKELGRTNLLKNNYKSNLSQRDNNSNSQLMLSKLDQQAFQRPQSQMQRNIMNRDVNQTSRITSKFIQDSYNIQPLVEADTITGKILNRSFQNIAQTMTNSQINIRNNSMINKGNESVYSQTRYQTPMKLLQEQSNIARMNPENPIKTPAESTSLSQSMTKSVSSSFTHALSSLHHQKQIMRMSYNTDSVYQRAMDRYLGQVNQKEHECLNDQDQLKQNVTDFQRHSDYLINRKRQIQENNKKYLLDQAKEKKEKEDFTKKVILMTTPQQTHFGPQEDEIFLERMKSQLNNLRYSYKQGLQSQLDKLREIKSKSQQKERQNDEKNAIESAEMHNIEKEQYEKRLQDNKQLCKQVWEEQIALKQKHKKLQGYLF